MPYSLPYLHFHIVQWLSLLSSQGQKVKVIQILQGCT